MAAPGCPLKGEPLGWGSSKHRSHDSKSHLLNLGEVWTWLRGTGGWLWEGAVGTHHLAGCVADGRPLKHDAHPCVCNLFRADGGLVPLEVSE